MRLVYLSGAFQKGAVSFHLLGNGASAIASAFFIGSSVFLSHDKSQSSKLLTRVCLVKCMLQVRKRSFLLVYLLCVEKVLHRSKVVAPSVPVLGRYVSVHKDLHDIIAHKR